MQIRLAREADVAAIVEISNWAALHTPANFAIEPELLEDWVDAWRETRVMHPWLVATNANEGSGEAGAVIGFAKSSPHRGRCAYAYTSEVSVYVHPEHHGKGVGTALYRRLLAILRAQGYVTILAGITLPNAASQRLHEAMGFRRVGVFQRVGWKFGRWHDVSYWQCDLANDESPPTRIFPVEQALSQC
jgi:phosphinothricin acetyltransferase